ncbi:MAG: PP2C family protein-serine/threonine phosphatase, partial [Pseudonocardiaceae bacterium]
MARPRPAERVLLVEDDPGDAFLVGELLTEVDPAIELVVAESICRVLDAGLLRKTDCVLLDLNLPGTSGLDGLRQLLRADPDAAICVLTGLDDEYLGIKAVAAGAQDYLVKGKADSAVLIRAIRYAVERRRAEASLRRLREQQLIAAESARLERGLLPRLLLDGSAVSAVPFYRCGRNAVIGGDFYDAVRCPDGSVHAIVGDVCGHGPDEAALGALLRVSWRALVLSGVGEPEVLPALQQVLVSERSESALFTTVCTVAIVDGTALIRTAGHPPPVLVRPRLIAQQPVIGLPLGINSSAGWKGLELPLEPGWALLLYTDGLIEGGSTHPGERLWEEGLL